MHLALHSGIDLIGPTVGLAFVGSMCTSNSVQLTQDGGMPLATVVSIATHEMGHNFNMSHDDEGGELL